MTINDLQDISHVYKGLILRSRAFASFKQDELEIIYADICKYITKGDEVFDPMSGYGGGMLFFGKEGFKTTNVELNPPSYFWQLLINPKNTNNIIDAINKLQSETVKLPKLKASFSLIDDLFSVEAISHIKSLYKLIHKCTNQNESLSIALLLPFVSRFANYIKSSTNITHFKQGGLCTYTGWEQDFKVYLAAISERISADFKSYKQIEHTNILSDFMKVNMANKYSFFVTSPPYPNYRDYSKLFKIENWVLDNIIFNKPTNFNMMIGSNNVSGKPYGRINSDKANEFLFTLFEKSNSHKLKPKSRSDIKSYYLPYFSQYFYNIQEAYTKLDSILKEKAMGYIVVNDNITRDIIVPVGASICDIFDSMGYKTEYFNISQINHYGNIGKDAKRINSLHTRNILKVWKK